MKSIKELFRIGNGPSSSHTIGPKNACLKFIERYSDVTNIVVTLYGSLALTGEGHSTDKIVKSVLKDYKVDVKFDKKTETEHPNTLDIVGYKNKVEYKMRFYSVGGGAIEIAGEDNDLPEVYPLSKLRYIIKYCENNNICDKVMIQTINRKAIRNNRGGDSKNRHQVYQPKAPCILPFTQFIVRPDGKVSLCCNDPLGEYTMADLNEVTIKEAWNSELYKAIRDKLKVTRQNITKCATCDNYSTTNQNGNMIFTREQIRDSWEAYHKGINIL